MGNNHPKYLSNAETQDIMTIEPWQSLHQQLSKRINDSKPTIDYNLFARNLQTNFDYMVSSFIHFSQFQSSTNNTTHCSYSLDFLLKYYFLVLHMIHHLIWKLKSL